MISKMVTCLDLSHFLLRCSVILKETYERFAKKRPIAVMFRAVLENTFSASEIDRIFAENAEKQRVSEELLFSSVVRLLGLAVCRVKRSVHAAYVHEKEQFEVSFQSVYNKLNGAEPQVARALVKQTAEQLEPILGKLQTTRPPLVPGYRVKILDGKHLSGTEHRIEETRTSNSAPLPGQALVVLDPERMLATDVFPCRDAHAQERSLLAQVLPTVQPGQLWVGDRNFCTTPFASGLAERDAFFLLREHAQNLPWEPVGSRRRIGRTGTGLAYEQTIRITHRERGQDRHRAARRITIELDEPTRDGETEIHLITNVPLEDAAARDLARLYQERWTIENAFQEISDSLEGEINTLAYPEAALLGYCLALIAYNVLSTVKAALRTRHGERAAPRNVSGYYLAHELSSAYDGMMIALPESFWEDRFGHLTATQMAQRLTQLAAKTNISRYAKSKYRPRSDPPKRTCAKDQPHVSTARILDQRRQTQSSRQ